MSLTRWFKEKWVDVKTGKDCGRGKDEKGRPYPACRPSKRISSKTPKTKGEMSKEEITKFKKEKTGLSPRQKARRKSFCARMSKAKGPLKKDGKLTRKALALRKWNCGSV